jgi:YbgC/YbaW family acyl-CoA thioester hydrolase
MPRFTYSRRVQFVDTDMAGIVHFANFYRWMEETEHAFFGSLGFKLVQEQTDGSVVGWPRVRSSCSFSSPAFYDDVLEVDLDIVRIGVKSLTMSFLFRRGETRIAAGELKTACCLHSPGRLIRSIEIPAHYREKLEPPAS